MSDKKTPFFTGLRSAKDFGPVKQCAKWPTGKYRGFVFTNWEMEWNWHEAKSWTSVTFLSIGDEIAPKTGKRHHQGAVYFKNARSCSGFAKLLPAGTFVEPAYGNEFQNEKYTQKDKKLLVIGAPAEQGKRWDLEDIREKIIKEGATPAIIAREPGMTYDDIKFAEAVFRLAGNAPKRRWKTMIVWLWGGAGKGKSHIARSLMKDTDESDIWTSSAKLDYWQQYQGQSTVWLDEFRGDKCTFTNLLQILDSTPFECNVKYGSYQLLAERIIVTSSMHPKEAYTGCSENVNQLLRRIEVIWNIDELYAACADNYEFPKVPGFDNFGPTMYLCAESKKTAQNPIRYEGRVCLELIGDEWVTCVEQKSLRSDVPALGVMEAIANVVAAPLTVVSQPAQKWGGNIGSDDGTTVLHTSTTEPPPTSLENKCSIPHAGDEYCADCVLADECTHEDVSDDGFGNTLCYTCGEYVVEIPDEEPEPVPGPVPSDNELGIVRVAAPMR